MRKAIFSVAGFMIAVMALVCAGAGNAQAQGVSLQDQLNAQYKLTKMGADTSGTSVVEAGTLLSVQKGGILAVPWTDANIMTTHYENGQVKSPNSAVMKGIGFGMKKYLNKDQTTHLVPTGDKVYFTGITVTPAKDQVSINIVECDTCNKTDPPTYMKATMVFQFAKGALATMQAGAGEDTIGEVFAVSDDSGAGGDQTAQQGGDQQQAAAG